MMIQEAAQVATQAASTAVSSQGNELIWSMVLAWLSSKGMEWAKDSKLVPWLTCNTETANRWAARVVALVAAVGVHFSFDGAAGVLTITGLTLAGIRDSGLEYARQLMFQSIAYSKFVKVEKAEEVVKEQILAVDPRPLIAEGGK